MEDSVTKSEYETVCAAQGGHLESFGRLYQGYYKEVMAIVWSVLGDHYLAEDVAQEVFLVALKDITRLREPEHFARWLANISRNLAKQQLRRKKVRSKANDFLKLCQADEYESDQKQQHDLVLEAIGHLSPKHCEVIILRFYNYMTYEQMSGLLGIGVQGVNGRLCRAKKKLENYLKRKGIEL